MIEERTGLPYPLYGPGLVRLLRRGISWADVVHAHGFLFLPSVLSMSLAKARAKRSPHGPARVLTEYGGHGAYDSRALRAVESTAIRTVGRRTLRAAEAVVAVNERIACFVRALIPGADIIDIPQGIDTNAYRPPEPGERDALRGSLGWDERPRVLFAGRLVPRKGADLAAEAVAMLGDEVELVVAGPGRLHDQATNLLALGEVSPTRMSELYRAADCLLLPSIAEGFPVVAQEALASGLPVILADDPAYAPYVEGAPDGIVLARRDVGALVEALKDLDFGRSIAVRQREKLAGFAAERYSLARCVDRHEELYARLAVSRSALS